MEKQEIEKLYKELGWQKIDDLYIYSCLLTSGFNKDDAYKNINLLYDLWLKDETGMSISSLSDALYENYEYIDFDDENLTTRKILVEITRYHDDEEDDEDYE